MRVETCVSMDPGEALNPTVEPRWNRTQAIVGGCRQTRRWIWNRLANHFRHVYATATQPWHDEFPTDWNQRAPGNELSRAVVVASRRCLELPTLTNELRDL